MVFALWTVPKKKKIEIVTKIKEGVYIQSINSEVRDDLKLSCSTNQVLRILDLIREESFYKD